MALRPYYFKTGQENSRVEVLFTNLRLKITLVVIII